MKLDFSSLTDLFRSETSERKEARLLVEAERLEERADHEETVAGLQKRISQAQKRIDTATKGSGKSGSSTNLSFLKRKPVAIVIMIVLVLLVVVWRSC